MSKFKEIKKEGKMEKNGKILKDSYLNPMHHGRTCIQDLTTFFYLKFDGT